MGRIIARRRRRKNPQTNTSKKRVRRVVAKRPRRIKLGDNSRVHKLLRGDDMPEGLTEHLTFFPEKRGGARCVMVGPSQSGKTFLLIRMLAAMRKRHGDDIYIMILSPNREFDKTWRDLSKKFQVKLYDWHRTSVSMKAMKEINLAIKKRGEWVKKKATGKRAGKKPPYLVLVLDDLGENSEIKFGRKNNPMRELSIQAPHKLTYMIMLNQYYMQTLPAVRGQEEFVILFPPETPEEIKLLRSKYFGRLTDNEYNMVIAEGWNESREHPYIYINKTNGVMKKRYFKSIFPPEEIVI